MYPRREETRVTGVLRETTGDPGPGYTGGAEVYKTRAYPSHGLNICNSTQRPYLPYIGWSLESIGRIMGSFEGSWEKGEVKDRKLIPAQNPRSPQENDSPDPPPDPPGEGETRTK